MPYDGGMNTTTTWFALLGRELELAQAELCAATRTQAFEFASKYALSTVAPPPDFDHLGGVVRAGEIIHSGSDHILGHYVGPIAEYFHSRRLSNKLQIGISAAGIQPRDLQNFGIALKKALRAQAGGSVRIVLPRQGLLLNAGHLEGAKLLSPPNAELSIIRTQAGFSFGISTWQQDISAYRHRDRDRPVRDARIGMLPPKLAQIMLNLAGVTKGSHVHDLFCGTGVVLSEAMQLGADVSGNDTNEAMVRATRTNLAWFQNELQLVTHQNTKIWLADARHVSLPESTTHIVSEGYLGNPHLVQATHERLTAEAQTLLPLYQSVLKHLSMYPQPLTLVLALPAWYHPRMSTPITLPILDVATDLGYTVEQFAPREQSRLLYRRPHQTVGRMIIRLIKH